MYSGVCIVGLHSWTAGKDQRPPTRTIHTPSALLPLTAQVSLLRTHKRLYKWGVGGGREGRKEGRREVTVKWSLRSRKGKPPCLVVMLGKFPFYLGNLVFYYHYYY